MSDVNLAEIQARADGATGTRYGMDEDESGATILWATADDMPFVHLGEIRPDVPQGDIDFLLHARADVPALVREVRYLRRLLDRGDQ
jgi:hypothetical protein